MHFLGPPHETDSSFSYFLKLRLAQQLHRIQPALSELPARIRIDTPPIHVMLVMSLLRLILSHCMCVLRGRRANDLERIGKNASNKLL
jgi:hypothetical protein